MCHKYGIEHDFSLEYAFKFVLRNQMTFRNPWKMLPFTIFNFPFFLMFLMFSHFIKFAWNLPA